METTGVPTKPWTMINTANALIEAMSKGIQEASNAKYGKMEETQNTSTGDIVVTKVANGFILTKSDGTNLIAKNSGEVAAFFVNDKEQLENFLLKFNRDALLEILVIGTGATTVAAKKKKGKKNAY